MSDIASADLKAVMLPIPTEMRIFVFLASGRDEEIEACWLRWGGITTFLTENPETAGICIFRPGADPEAIRGFYRRAGKEANVFEYRPAQKDFRRITPNEFSLTNGLSSAYSL